MEMVAVSNKPSCEANTSFENELLTVAEVADYLRVSRVTVWRWCQQEVIPASQVGRIWRIHRDDLLQILHRSPSTKSSIILPLPLQSAKED